MKTIRGKTLKLTRKRLRGAKADTPWVTSMSTKYGDEAPSREDGSTVNGSTSNATVAAFSPNQQTASRTRTRGSVLIHQKSPLLVATPPQVTRALAYSHPFILPLNHAAGLLSWTGGDSWESFLLVANFWFWVTYYDNMLLWTGPIMVTIVLILGMYSRRYSPLSSTVWSDSKNKRKRADSEARKSLDEILATLNEFTARCHVLLDPFLRLTEYLSTQSSATSATTRPALTTLFIRILAFTPVWIGLTLPPFRVITSQRIIITVGTIGLTWHSRPARVCRTILWRSRTVRRSLSLLTGLHFTGSSTSHSVPTPNIPARAQAAAAIARKTKGGSSTGVRFTFSIYENQRRWLGLGWTYSLLPGDGYAWTDEYHHPSPDTRHYMLPETDNDTTRWRWVPGSEWRVEGGAAGASGVAKSAAAAAGTDAGWTYFDNYWRDPRRADGFTRYTRKRKWIRDAELVEASVGDAEEQQQQQEQSGGDVSDSMAASTATLRPTTPPPSASSPSAAEVAGAVRTPPTPASAVDNEESNDSLSPAKQRRPWFRRRGISDRPGSRTGVQATIDRTDAASATGSGESRKSRESAEEDVITPLERISQGDWDRSVNPGVLEGLG